jgi:hypothetical protein
MGPNQVTGPLPIPCPAALHPALTSGPHGSVSYGARVMCLSLLGGPESSVAAASFASSRSRRTESTRRHNKLRAQSGMRGPGVTRAHKTPHDYLSRPPCYLSQNRHRASQSTDVREKEGGHREKSPLHSRLGISVWSGSFSHVAGSRW